MESPFGDRCIDPVAVGHSRPGPGSNGGKPIRIVQPNIGQQDKWRPGYEQIAARKLDLLTIKGRPQTRLVFWPEAAVTNPLVDQRAAARWQSETERLSATRSLPLETFY